MIALRRLFDPCRNNAFRETRETVASDIVRQDNSIIAAFKVQKRLDLEDVRTGFNYLQRFATDVIKREIASQYPIFGKSYRSYNSFLNKNITSHGAFLGLLPLRQ